MTKSKAATLRVFIVLIETDAEGPGAHTPYTDTKIGAVYTTMIEALAEALRLTKANSFTQAKVVTRETSVPTHLQPRRVGT